MTAALLTAPMTDAAQEDDSSILAVVVAMHGASARTWISPAASANPRVQFWCRHALDDGQHIAILTMLDLMALPPAV